MLIDDGKRIGPTSWVWGSASRFCYSVGCEWVRQAYAVLDIHTLIPTLWLR